VRIAAVCTLHANVSLERPLDKGQGNTLAHILVTVVTLLFPLNFQEPSRVSFLYLLSCNESEAALSLDMIK